MYVMQFISNESTCSLVFTFTCQSDKKAGQLLLLLFNAELCLCVF